MIQHNVRGDCEGAKLNTRRNVIIALGAGLLAAPLATDAQPAGKVYRIGFIQTAPRKEITHLIKALDEGIRELGYVEGRNAEMLPHK